MKQINIFKSFLIAACALFALTVPVPAQSVFDQIKNKVKEKTKSEAGSKMNSGDPKYLNWARLDVQASWKENGQTEYERRTYYSDIISITERVPDERESVSAYFNEGIVEQLKARGIEIQYYLQTVEVFPKSQLYASRSDAEEQRTKMIENDKDGGRAVYTFVWKFNAENVSEEITQPKRIFAPKPAPPMEAKTAVVNTAEREAKTQAVKDAKAEAEIAQREKKIWGFARLDVRVKNKFGQTSSRTYVSEIAPISRDDYNAFYNTDERFIKPRIWEYFAATVAAAAKERGEEIEEPYDGSILYKFSLETTGNDVGVGEAYRFQPKSVLVEPRQREIDYAQQSSRPVFFFRWDTSGKNVQADLEKERNRRGDSKDLPN